jgi:hypothetical protein
MLTLVLGCIENQTVPGRFGSVEDGALVVPSIEHLIQPLDPDGFIRNPARALKQLAVTGALIVERRHQELRIRPGRVLRAALDGKKGKP